MAHEQPLVESPASAPATEPVTDSTAAPAVVPTARAVAGEFRSQRLSMQKRARLAVCGGAALLLLFHTVGLLWIEWRRPDLADPEFGLRLRAWQRMATEERQVPTLAVVGSSRFACGIDTETLSQPPSEEQAAIPATNLSLAGGTAVWQHIVLRRLAAYGPKPRRVLLELFPKSLLGGESAVFSAEHQFPTHRLRHVDLAALQEILPEQAAGQRGLWWRRNGMLPLKTHGVAFWNGICPLFKTDDLFLQTEHWRRSLSPTGFGPWGVAQPTAEQRAAAWQVAQLQYGSSLREGALDSRVIDIYRQTLAWCQTNGIEVAALVLMPESPQFQTLYSPRNWEAIGKVAEQLSRESGRPVVDARNWLPSEEAFADGHHLLPAAAREFTLRLAESLPTGLERPDHARTATTNHDASTAPRTN